MATTRKNNRELRWNFRVAESEDAVVRAASEQAEMSFTSFVRQAALDEAKRVLADRREIVLDQPEWERFKELLERPARVPAGLRDLFSRRNVFE